jgi:hypothetical protein
MSSTPMEWADFQSEAENTDAVRKTLGAVLALAPITAPEPGPLVDPTGKQVMSLPTAYWPVGLLTPEGISHDREVETGAVDALGHFSPVREDIDSAVRRVTFRGYELHRANIVALSEGVAPESLPEVEGHEVRITMPSRPLQRFYRCLAISFDGNLDAPWFDAAFYPKVSVTSFPSDTWAKGEARSYEIGLTAYEDSALGYDKATTFAGVGFSQNAEALGWTIASAA